MGRWVLISMVLVVATAASAAEPVSHGVALSADGIVLAAKGPEGRTAYIDLNGTTHPARILASDDELGLVLLGSEARLSPAMLADDKTLAESKNFCALTFPSEGGRCDKLRLAGKGGPSHLGLSAGSGELPAGTPVFSRRGKLVGLLIPGTTSETAVIHSRAIRRLISTVPGLAEKLVPMRSSEVSDFRRLPAQVSAHIVNIRYDGASVPPPPQRPAEQVTGAKTPAREPVPEKPAGKTSGKPPLKEATTKAAAKSKQARLGPEQEIPISAADLEKIHADGSRHFHAGRHTEAFRAYRQGAERGHARSQVSLGLLYEEGLGVPRDYEVAASWYRKAAEAGELLGYMNLGRMFELGRGVAEDPFHAAVLYSKAAERGHKPAHQALDRLLHKGR